jgi:hypothetical protein
MPECAFCDHVGKLSNEHVISQWLAELFPGRVTSWYGTHDPKNGFAPKQLPSTTLDFKVKTVCKRCNETWMSDIESKHAKPALTPLVSGEMDIPITKEMGHSLSLFAFKTAAVLDYAHHPGSPFFARRLRHAFRKDHFIPRFVQMWMCGYSGHRAGAHIRILYHNVTTPTGYRLKLYVCTCALGHFVFQVLGVTQPGSASIRSLGRFKEIAVPFWPTIPRRFVWPYSKVLMSETDFNDFASRWENVEIPKGY